MQGVQHGVSGNQSAVPVATCRCALIAACVFAEQALLCFDHISIRVSKEVDVEARMHTACEIPVQLYIPTVHSFISGRKKSPAKVLQVYRSPAPQALVIGLPALMRNKGLCMQTLSVYTMLSPTGLH